MATIIDFSKKNAFVIILLAFFGYLFFFHLDYNTLSSWDEAWYGSIAREITKTGDYMHLIWNGRPYYDHPPIGFWLMAISYKLLGINELSTRIPSALLGLMSIVLVYYTGIELFRQKVVGFVAALILGTCVWYTIRVRSGNLDSGFVFFYILTIYLAVRSHKDFRWFPSVAVAFGGLILSKTLVGFSAVALILFLNYQHFLQRKNLMRNTLLLIGGVVLWGAVVLPWYYINYQTYPDFLQHHFFDIGTRDKTFLSYFELHPQQPLFYLHMGIRKWYYLWIASLGFIILLLKFLKRNVLFLLLWNIVILYPFLTAKETQLWHLIPVYVPLAFITAVGFYELATSVRRIVLIKKYVSVNSMHGLYLLFFILIAFVQFTVFKNEVIPPNKYIPDDVDISRRAGHYTGKIYLDDDFTPLAVFYSQKNMLTMTDQPTLEDQNAPKTLVTLFQSNDQHFVAVTRSWAVNNLKDNNIPYKILDHNNSFAIVSRP